MTIPTVIEQVRWQDLRVRSEIDIVLEIAKEKGWEDCEVFGYGDMITEPQESMGWKLIPADIYKYSIPMPAVARLHEIINAGVRVQGVIIADDGRRVEPAPPPAPAKRKVSLPSLKPIMLWIGKALLGCVHVLGAVVSWIGKMLLGYVRALGAIASFSGKALLALMRAAGVIALIAFFVYALIHFFWPVMLLGFLMMLCTGTDTTPGASTRIKYDPKLVILIDDGSGRTAWVSLYTWYD